jgi:two-component system, NtrC family, sensor kinase
VRVFSKLFFPVALPLALLCAMSWMAYRDAERAALTRLEDLTRVMEEHAERALDTNAMVFRQLKRVLNGDSEARLRAREGQLHELLSAICDRLPHLRSITIWSTDGRVLVSSHVYPVPRSLTPADWQEYRQMPAPGVWSVSALVLDRTTGEHYFRMAQARERGGVLEIALQPSHFAEFYNRLAKTGDHVQFRLVSGAGAVLAGAPATTGHYEVSRGVGAYPLFVVASQPAMEVFAPWRRQTTVLAAIAIPSALALLIASLLALKRARRIREAEEALRHSQKMEALGELTGGVAHDFGNLLAVVQNSAHLLELTEPRLKGSRPLASIRKAIESGSRLTRQLLTFSRRQPPAHAARDDRSPEKHGRLARCARPARVARHAGGRSRSERAGDGAHQPGGQCARRARAHRAHRDPGARRAGLRGDFRLR